MWGIENALLTTAHISRLPWQQACLCGLWGALENLMEVCNGRKTTEKRDRLCWVVN